MKVGVESNYVAAWRTARIRVPRKSGLIVAICGFAAVTYTYSVIFGTAKSARARNSPCHESFRGVPVWRKHGASTPTELKSMRPLFIGLLVMGIDAKSAPVALVLCYPRRASRL